jgi:hypothetical protein
MIDSENSRDAEQRWKRWPGSATFKARHLTAADPGIAREEFLGEAPTGAQDPQGCRNLGTKRALAVADERSAAFGQAELEIGNPERMVTASALAVPRWELVQLAVGALDRLNKGCRCEQGGSNQKSPPQGTRSPNGAR